VAAVGSFRPETQAAGGSGPVAEGEKIVKAFSAESISLTDPILTRNAAWKAFAEDPAAELRDAFRMLDESRDAVAPDRAAIAAEVRAWRARR